MSMTVMAGKKYLLEVELGALEPAVLRVNPGDFGSSGIWPALVSSSLRRQTRLTCSRVKSRDLQTQVSQSWWERKSQSLLLISGQLIRTLQQESVHNVESCLISGLGQEGQPG